MVGIFDPDCELLPPWTKELYLITVAPPLSLWPPPPLSTQNVQYIHFYTDSVWLWGGAGGGMLNCALEHILREFNTLFLTRFRTYKIASPTRTKWPVKTTGNGVFKVPSSMVQTHWAPSSLTQKSYHAGITVYIANRFSQNVRDQTAKILVIATEKNPR